MGKRLRKARSLHCCCSPRISSCLTPHSIFNWYEEDVWTAIAKFMDGRSLVMLASTCKWFHRVMMEESVWKYACLRDLQVPDTGRVEFKWINLYASVFDGSHSYSFYENEKHLDWMRIGAFVFDSDGAFLTESLIVPLRISREEIVEKMLEKNGNCVLRNIKTGIWIADIQLVRCPVCDLETCEGTMQTLEARHIELFLCEGYLNGSWEYELLGSYHIQKQADAASGGIFDIKHFKNRSTSDILNLKTWVGKKNDFQPKAMITLNAVAVSTNLQLNEGLQIKYHVMKAGKEGKVVAIRISQQLV